MPGVADEGAKNKSIRTSSLFCDNEEKNQQERPGAEQAAWLGYGRGHPGQSGGKVEEEWRAKSQSPMGQVLRKIARIARAIGPPEKWLGRRIGPGNGRLQPAHGRL